MPTPNQRALRESMSDSTAHACFVFPNSPGRPRGCPTVSACLGGTEASLRADPVEADWSPFADEEEESCNSPSNRKLPIVSLGIDPWLKQGSGAIPSEFGKSLASSWQLQVYYRCLWKWLNKWLVSSWFPLMYQPNILRPSPLSANSLNTTTQAIILRKLQGLPCYLGSKLDLISNYRLLIV